MSQPVEFLTTAAIGTRAVVRTRIPGGFTDALGYLLACDDTHCTVDTKRGPVALLLTDVSAAKAVPEPPARRSRSSG